MPLQTLLARVREEQLAMQAFIDALDTEAQNLSSRAAPDVLLASIQAKDTVAQTVVKATDLRNEALVAMGYSPDRNGAQDAALDHPEELAPAVSHLFETALIAKSRNERNRELIDLLQDSTRQALALLRSAAGANLYGPKGKQPRHPSGLGSSRTA